MWLFHLGSNPSPTAKLTHIVKESSYLEWLQVTWCMPQFGTMSKLCELTEETLISTSFMEGFPARISVLQELEKAWQESEAGLFTKYSDYPENLNPPSFSWKMSQQLQPEAVWHWSKKLPRWGMTVDGVLYPLLPLERYTVAKDGSYWPTPDASARGARKNQNGHTINLQDVVGSGKLNPQWVEWLMGYKTGWTDLEDWAMQWLLSKQKKRSKS